MAPRLSAAIATGLLCIAVPIALHATPGGTRPVNPVLHPAPSGRVAGALTPARPSTRSDTVGKSEKGKPEHGAPAPRRKLLKGRQTSPAAASDPRQYVPDQPWETEFFVENDVIQPPHSALMMLASSRR